MRSLLYLIVALLAITIIMMRPVGIKTAKRSKICLDNKENIGAIVKARTLALQQASSNLVQRALRDVEKLTTDPQVSDLDTAQKAEQGDAEAQYKLAEMYCSGQDVQQDYTKALYWCRKAAEQGYARAQYILGMMYAKGKGIPKDYAKAAKWYHKAAEQGYADAQSDLGAMYAEGQGAPQDDAKALYWFYKAAEQGLAQAQYNLGVMYAKGKGVTRSNMAAADWFYKAGLSYLKEGKRDDALRCVKMIKNLGNIPNAFLANKLLAAIYK